MSLLSAPLHCIRISWGASRASNLAASLTSHRLRPDLTRARATSASNKSTGTPPRANYSRQASPSDLMPSDLEAAKRLAAQRAVQDHFDPSFENIGIGSGTTVVHVVEAIKHAGDTTRMKFVPTGQGSRQLVLDAGLTCISFDSLLPGMLLDVCFDGADEVDEALNCIKGGGACLYQEKLVATHSKKFVCVADFRKLQPRLLSKWRTVPVEVEPLAATAVITMLHALGSTNAQVRHTKEAILRTDQGNYIVDAPFATLLLPRDLSAEREGNGASGGWEVKALAREIKMIEGVLSVGIFSGESGAEAMGRGKERGGEKPVAAYFGMADGTVTLREAGKDDVVLKS